MKKKLLLVSLFLVVMTMNAQFTLEDSEGSPVIDGDIIEFGVLGYPDANWDFYVNNTSSTEDIYMKIEFVSAVNADGSMMELCFGLCYTGISVGSSYPPSNDFVEIAPGEQTGPGNHLVNSEPGNGTDAVEYVFRYYQVDATGTNEIGTPLSITYRYDPLLGVGDFNKLNVTISSTIINNEMTVNTVEELNMLMYDLQGRLVKSQKLNVGQQIINTSDLSSQIYIVNFKNNQGLSDTIKVLVK